MYCMIIERDDHCLVSTDRDSEIFEKHIDEIIKEYCNKGYKILRDSLTKGKRVCVLKNHKWDEAPTEKIKAEIA